MRLYCNKGRIRFQISSPFGRAGNNIQQILVAIAHAEVFRGVLDIDQRFLSECNLLGFVQPFSLDFGSHSSRPLIVDERRFFHFTEYAFGREDFFRMRFGTELLPRRDSLLSRNYLEANLWRLAQNYLLSHIADPLSFGTGPFNERLVMHLRAGDVASLSHDYYIPNPLCYYRWLRSFHEDITVVMEPGEKHLLFREILSLFRDVDVVSGSFQEDLQRLRSAKYLASSGVSTFPVAAALLSSCLDTFYCSSLYLSEHLNPQMLIGTRVNVQLLNLPDFQSLWLRSGDRLGLLSVYEPSPSGETRQSRSSPRNNT